MTPIIASLQHNSHKSEVATLQDGLLLLLPSVPNVILDQVPLLRGANRKFEALDNQLTFDTPNSEAGEAGYVFGMFIYYFAESLASGLAMRLTRPRIPPGGGTPPPAEPAPNAPFKVMTEGGRPTISFGKDALTLGYLPNAAPPLSAASGSESERRCDDPGRAHGYERCRRSCFSASIRTVSTPANPSFPISKILALKKAYPDHRHSLCCPGETQGVFPEPWSEKYHRDQAALRRLHRRIQDRERLLGCGVSNPRSKHRRTRNVDVFKRGRLGHALSLVCIRQDRPQYLVPAETPKWT